MPKPSGTMELDSLAHRLRTEYPLRETPVPASGNASAVMVMLYMRFGQPHVLLIQRAHHLRLHPGQISFPGGTPEPSDGSLLATALRETREELAIDLPESQVHSQLHDVQTLTGFAITPFVIFLEPLPAYRKNPEEVKEALEVPLAPLLATGHREMGYPPEKQMVAYWFLNHRVWGATAKILNQIDKLGLKHCF